MYGTHGRMHLTAAESQAVSGELECKGPFAWQSDRGVLIVRYVEFETKYTPIYGR